MSQRGASLPGKLMLRRLLHLLARPVRRDRGRGGVLIQPYRGYGSAEEIYLMGRVFRQPRDRIQMGTRSSSPSRDVLDVVRRFMRRGVRDAVLMARIGESGATDATTAEIQTDHDGYFHVRLRLNRRLATDQRWHSVDLELVEPAELAGDQGAKARGHVFVPPPTAQRVIISDIDDTVICSGGVNQAKLVWRFFMQGLQSRVVFPGVASLYRALHHGPSGDQLNPMLYVSRSPWSIYEILEDVFRFHHIPVGPILFLREWGISLTRPLPRRAEDHKLIVIRDMLELYHDFPFVLIGDSGQHDPEIYAQVVREHPGRVAAVYIRNVRPSESRVRALEELAKQVIDNGSTLMVSADSFSMAQHAAAHGLIDSLALQTVLQERNTDEALGPTQDEGD